MNFKETVDYLASAEQYGIIPGLDSIKRLCHKLSDPQDTLNIIHIAGTNGKDLPVLFLKQFLEKPAIKQAGTFPLLLWIILKRYSTAAET